MIFYFNLVYQNKENNTLTNYLLKMYFRDKNKIFSLPIFNYRN